MIDELIARLKDDRDTIKRYQAERGVTVFDGLISDLDAAIAALGGLEVVRMVATNIRANLHSLPSIAEDWANKLDSVATPAQPKVPK